MAEPMSEGKKALAWTLAVALMLALGSVGAAVAISYRETRDGPTPWVIASAIFFLGALLILGFLVVPHAWRWVRSRRRQSQTSRSLQVLAVQHLARELTLGRHTFSDIEQADRRYRDLMKEIDENGRPENLEERLKEVIVHPEEVDDWQRRVGDYLTKNFGYQARAMFENNAGLSPATPPKNMDDFFAKQWVEHDFRLQRLHQFIQREAERDS